MSNINDWKNTNNGNASTTGSNPDMISDVISPSPNKINSQGILLPIDLKTDSSKSSSLDKPPSFA